MFYWTGTSSSSSNAVGIVPIALSPGVVLESDIYNPLYKYHVTLPGNLPSTSTVVLKIYSLHVNTGSHFAKLTGIQFLQKLPNI